MDDLTTAHGAKIRRWDGQILPGYGLYRSRNHILKILHIMDDLTATHGAKIWRWNGQILPGYGLYRPRKHIDDGIVEFCL